jgi:cytochrome c biogenesis protein CcmG/thiol:disulfide interchange protein DsbE
MLNELSAKGVKIIGLNYKDQRAQAKAWLAERGNPYQFNIFDAQGQLGIDLGVYGAPETFLVDASGIVRHRRVGVVDERVWNTEFRALYEQLTGSEQ